MSHVVIGKAVKGELMTLGDLERLEGVHLFGRSGTAKSTLLISLLLQDIQRFKTEGNRRCRRSSSAEIPSRID